MKITIEKENDVYIWNILNLNAVQIKLITELAFKNIVMPDEEQSKCGCFYAPYDGSYTCSLHVLEDLIIFQGSLNFKGGLKND